MKQKGEQFDRLKIPGTFQEKQKHKPGSQKTRVLSRKLQKRDFHWRSHLLVFTLGAQFVRLFNLKLAF